MQVPGVREGSLTFLCSRATFSGNSWITCCFPNAAASRKQNVEPVVVSRQARTRPSHGPKMAPANMFYRTNTDELTRPTERRSCWDGLVSPGRRSQGLRKTVCIGRRCRRAAERSRDVAAYKTGGFLQAPAARPGPTGTSAWRDRRKRSVNQDYLWNVCPPPTQTSHSGRKILQQDETLSRTRFIYGGC